MDGKELEKRSSVNLHWRNGTKDGCYESVDALGNFEYRFTFVPS